MEKCYVKLMKRCITLAKQARGKTSPNPIVGCVIVDDEGNILSEGYHHFCGANHAEREALSKADNFENATLVVNLEPCCHYGKTPPCVDLIIDKGIKKVVYGMQDPNPLVAGKGLEKLRKAGVIVQGPVLENECKDLNEVFIKNKLENKVFVVIKTATTIDGKIATKTGDSKWITSEASRKKARNLRNLYDAILTSASTILADNPSMKHKNKIIIDRELKTDVEMPIYNDGNIYIFYCEDKNNTLKSKHNKRPDIKFIKAPQRCSNLDIEFVLKKIFEFGIMSVFVESGGKLNESFLPYADKLYYFMAPKILGDNCAKSCFDGANIEKISQCAEFNCESVKSFGPDLLVVFSKKCSM